MADIQIHKSVYLPGKRVNFYPYAPRFVNMCECRGNNANRRGQNVEPYTGSTPPLHHRLPHHLTNPTRHPLTTTTQAPHHKYTRQTHKPTITKHTTLTETEGTLTQHTSTTYKDMHGRPWGPIC